MKVPENFKEIDLSDTANNLTIRCVSKINAILDYLRESQERQTTSGESDFRPLSESQLERLGLKYKEGKPEECSCKDIGPTLAYLNDDCKKHGKPSPQLNIEELDVDRLFDEYCYENDRYIRSGKLEHKDRCREIKLLVKEAVK